MIEEPMWPPRNPKNQGPLKETAWYRYYAGYTEAFVLDVLQHWELPPGSLVLDPWVGSGTTTVVASNMGMTAHGYDANPAAALVARARLLSADVEDSIEPLAKEAITLVNRPHARSGQDPLEQWFTPSTAGVIRRLEKAIYTLLVNHDSYDPSPKRDLGHYSSLASFFYVVLFEVVRQMTLRFGTTNPTWMKVPSSEAGRIHTNKTKVHDSFLLTSVRLAGRLTCSQPRFSPLASVALSECLPLADHSVDAIITSPPYCTRIDYAVSMRPELAVLGFSNVDVATLRRTMIGSPLVGGAESSTAPLPDSVQKVVARISAHQSKASASYYGPYYRHYFSSIARSAQELARVAKVGARMAMVVQGSYYKDFYVDTPGLVSEVFRSRGWDVDQRIDYPAVRTLATINRSSGLYRQTSSPTEAVLLYTQRQ